MIIIYNKKKVDTTLTRNSGQYFTWRPGDWLISGRSKDRVENYCIGLSCLGILKKSKQNKKSKKFNFEMYTQDINTFDSPSVNAIEFYA